MKVGRNDPCPCGSGKKYKKCCLNNLNSLELPNEDKNEFYEFIDLNNSVELLKIFSLLQLLPKNHSKVVRFETIQDTICIRLNNKEGKVDCKKLHRIINEIFESDYREDPSENCFTENIMLHNGNNIVFPGIATESTLVNQNLLNASLLYDNSLSELTKTKIKDGTIFLLHILNNIAKELGYTRHLFEDDYRGKIFFPLESFIRKKMDLFEFSKSDIQKIYERYGIKDDIIQEFISFKKEISDNKGDETILILKPFIEFNDKYYLVLPSAQMYSLNQFILRCAAENNELKLLENYYDDSVQNESLKYLSSFWRELKLDIDLKEYESIWEVDTNKLAYVCYLTKSSKKRLEARANKVIKMIRRKEPFRSHTFLCVHLFAPFSIKMMRTLAFGLIKEAKYQIALSVFNLNRIINFWEIDKLSFWKYAQAKVRAESRGLTISPFSSILAHFKYYKRNKESFFEVDEKTGNFLYFDFGIQGGVVIESSKKSDPHLISYMNEEMGLGYVSTIKTETYAPIYTSEEIFNGKLRVALEKYNCPIWVSTSEKWDFLGKNFVDAILYWLNELYEPLRELFIPFSKAPIEVSFSFDKSFKDFSKGIKTNLKEKVNIGFNINPYLRRIELIIPAEIFNALHRSDNHGERILMNSLLKGVSNLLEIYKFERIEDDDIMNLLNDHMPLSRAKMIMTSNSHNNLNMDIRFIPKARYIYESDTAIVLEDNVNWLNGDSKIPKEITSINDKLKLCNDLINSLIDQLRLRLTEYNSNDLLVHLLLRYESLLQVQAHRDLGITTRLECFSKYQDVIDEYQEFNHKLIKSSHSLRSLIEFVVAEPYFGDKVPNDNDSDFLLALINEVINYGAIKDSIRFEINNPKMGLLPSGRIGVSKEFYDNTFMKYRESVTKDEIIDYQESFEGKFRNSINVEEKKQEKDSQDLYFDKVDLAFMKDWGITLPKIHATMIILGEVCFENNKSFFSCSEKEFIEILKTKINLNNEEIEALFNNMVLVTRGNINEPIEKEDFPEIFPWRFNRKYSFIRKPILKIKNRDDSYTILWSARHLNKASENLLYLFLNGLLKVNPGHKNIAKLLAERNNIKGKEFRNKIRDWFKTKKHLKVIDHEVKISVKGFLKAERNFGDVDILVFDLKKKILYSIECKNTKQVKIMYDFHSDVRNYVNRQLPKHLNRDIWLKNNIVQIGQKFDLNLKGFKIKSLVISSYQLPIKFMKKVKIPIFSFNEIKTGNYFK